MWKQLQILLIQMRWAGSLINFAYLNTFTIHTEQYENPTVKRANFRH